MPPVRKVLLIIVACLALAIAGCGDDSSTTDTASSSPTTTEEPSGDTTSESSEQKTKPKVTVPDGPPPKKLVINDLEVGTGATAKAGDEITVQYVGVGYKSGSEFDSSWSRSEPLIFNLGTGQVIPGWEEGIQGMKVGGRRELIIPPQLAYGSAGAPPAIGPNEALIFVVDLEAVK